ncbi:MAG: hypothetical protein PHV34_22665 [Verrucomicrobiae bacterium]|nr:hypothetical protein [Verrucomicrobiae bacterium]
MQTSAKTSYVTRTQGSLVLYRGLVSSAASEAGAAMGQPVLAGDVRLLGGEISGCNGNATYGVCGNSEVCGVKLSNSKAGVYNFTGKVSDCVFSNLTVAIKDGRSLDVELVRCRFQNNERNFEICYGGAGATLVDCDISPARFPNVLRRWKNREGEWRSPRILIKRHLVLRVVDDQGRPVVGALVDVNNERADGPVPEYGATLTDANGLTPPAESGRAIYLVESVEEARETASAFERYTYNLKISANGKTKEIKGLVPGNDWRDNALNVVIERR